MDFGIAGTQHLQGGADHVTLFSVTHPRCHVGVQAVVWGARANPPTSVGQYRLQIVISDDALPGFPNCGPFGNESPFSGPFALQLGSIPAYELSLHSFLPFGPYNLYADADATLRNANTSAVITSVQFPGYYTAPYTYYSGEAKRFGFGGVRTSLPVPLTFDNFIGVAQ